MNKGKLFVLSAPSGCGKDTVLQLLFEKHPEIKFSISTVTRPMRDGEINGEKYNFITRDEFELLLKNDELLEYNEYVGNYYGTPKKPVFEWMDKGYNVILEIDVNGAFNVKSKYPEAVSVFMMPPSFAALKDRLYARGTDDDETINKRLAVASYEISCAEKYDYVFINDDLDAAVDDLYAIIRANALLKDNMIEFINEVEKNA